MKFSNVMDGSINIRPESDFTLIYGKEKEREIENYATTSGNIGQLRNIKQLKAISNSSLKSSEKVEFSA